MNKRKLNIVLLVIFVVVFIAILSYLGVLTVRGLCGFKYGHMAKLQGAIGKEWACECVGITSAEFNSYTEKTYCTGLNLSINKLNQFVCKNQQCPIGSIRSN